MEEAEAEASDKKLFISFFFFVIIVLGVNMIKMIFSDFDETMLNYNSGKIKCFNNYQVDILKRLKEKGIGFSIVTGRQFSFFERFPEILYCVSYIISSNGACIYDVFNKSIIFKSNLKNHDVKEIISYAKKMDNDFYLNIDGIQYYNNDNMGYDNCEQVVLSIDDDLEDNLANLSCNSLLSFNNISKHDDYITIDINNIDVSKGNGVSYLCKYLNIDLNDTICFGDSFNDVSMFRVVGKSFSVGNAVDKIKVFTNDVTLPSSENGIFKYIEDNILNK